MDKKKIGQQIKIARKNAKMTQKAVAKLFPQCTRQSVMNWEAGLGFPSRERWPVLEQAFGLPAGWFLTLQSEGGYLFDDASKVISGNVTLSAMQIRAEGHVAPPPVADATPARYVTVLRRVSAGEPREFGEDDVVGKIAVGPDIPAGAYAWEVSGDSMLRPDGRGIRDGDVVFFVEETSPAHNDVVLVNDEFGDTVLKRLKLRPDGEYVLVSDNPDYKSVTPNEAFRIVGKVVDVIRKPDWR